MHCACVMRIYYVLFIFHDLTCIHYIVISPKTLQHLPTSKWQQCLDNYLIFSNGWMMNSSTLDVKIFWHKSDATERSMSKSLCLNCMCYTFSSKNICYTNIYRHLSKLIYILWINQSHLHLPPMNSVKERCVSWFRRKKRRRLPIISIFVKFDYILCYSQRCHVDKTHMMSF